MPPLIVLCAIGVGLLPVKSLEIKAAHSGRLLLLEPLFHDISVELRYIHSVEKIPVSGRFQVTKAGQIFPKETIFSSFGPGLPFSDLVRTPRGEMAHLAQKPPPMDRLGFYMDPDTKPFLSVEGREVPLEGLPRGEIIAFEITRRPLLEALWEDGKRRFFSRSRGS